MASFQKVKYSAYNADLGMCEVDCRPTTCANRRENSLYGSCRKVVSIVERSLDIFADGSINSPKILALLAWDARNVYASAIFKGLFAIGSQSIMLKAFRVSNIRFFSFVVSLIILFFLLNLQAHRDMTSL
jgi:hypothetical protein